MRVTLSGDPCIVSNYFKSLTNLQVSTPPPPPVNARAQASFWYSQGCYIGCPTCDNASGRRQVDLCGLGKKQTLTDPKYWSVNRDAAPFSEYDIYQVLSNAHFNLPSLQYRTYLMR